MQCDLLWPWWRRCLTRFSKLLVKVRISQRKKTPPILFCIIQFFSSVIDTVACYVEGCAACDESVVGCTQCMPGLYLYQNSAVPQCLPACPLDFYVTAGDVCTRESFEVSFFLHTPSPTVLTSVCLTVWQFVFLAALSLLFSPLPVFMLLFSHSHTACTISDSEAGVAGCIAASSGRSLGACFGIGLGLAMALAAVVVCALLAWRMCGDWRALHV